MTSAFQPFITESLIVLPVSAYQDILKRLKMVENEVKQLSNNTHQTHLSKNQFLKAIGKSNFVYNDLVKGSFQLQVVHRGKSVYIPITEVQRYFQSLI